MPSTTGFWNDEEARTNHDFSYKLAKFIGEYFKKEDHLVDFGCGPGTYLRYLHDIGFTSLMGYEAIIPDGQEFNNIGGQDLATSFNMLNKAVNGLCLEVGEHIPKEYEAIFLDNLCNNCTERIVLSWAIPGQSGYGHVNCQYNIYIVQEMERRGWKMLVEDSLEARQHVEDRVHYFRDTLMIFGK